MIIIIVILWVLVGLGVFFLAMRRGTPRAGARRAGESKASRVALIVGLAAVLAFGVAVPTIVLAFNGQHKASAGVGGVHLTASEQRGRDLFAHACGVCHTLSGAKAVGRIGPNLDVRVGVDIATTAGKRALVLNAVEEGRARGLGQMPPLLYQGREAQEVAEFVAAVAGH
ncbi:MAG TPA: c-type cytochrome [Solirubrobacteraceae bacterium]|nr:c-type cytochrome [Solirubrobacteraceae bacterium]